MKNLPELQTPKNYIDNSFDIIPCNKDSKKPKLEDWSNLKIKLEDFKEGDNIGLRLGNLIDIDFDNPIALNFQKYLAPSLVCFGKEGRITHYLYKGSSKAKKFIFPEEFSKWGKNFSDRHEFTIIENRSGKGLQTIMPGSVVLGKEVKWVQYGPIDFYPNHSSIDDCGKIALATALTILYPTQGNRDEYCFSIAGILARYTKWTENQIDEFISDIATVAKDEEIRARAKKGTHAKKQLEAGSSVMGFPKLLEILNLEEAKPLYNIFEWVGVKPPNKFLEELRRDHVFIKNSMSMYNLKDELEFRKEDFNNINLFKFPGSKGSEYAFQTLMKDYEFQEKRVIGRACLPGYTYPIFEINKNHLYLKPGKYLNLYKGHPFEPIKGDVSTWVNTYKKLLGEKKYDYIEQYLAAMFKKIFKHLLKLTEEEKKEVGEMKIQWGILLVGPEGTAKKALARTVSRLIGIDHVDTNASFDQMISNHSEVIYNKLFVCINEVVSTGAIDKKVEISNKLKNFWTDEDAKINPKHIRPFHYWNNANGICFSNEKDCLHISNSARRYLVIHQDISINELKGFEEDGTFADLYEFIHSDKIAHLFYYFLFEVKIKDWKIYRGGRAPISEDLLTMQEEGKHPVVQRLSRALSEKLAPFNNPFIGFVSLDALLNFIRNDWKTQINEKYIKDWLNEVGFLWNNGKKTRQIVHWDIGRPRVYLLEDNDVLREMTEGELGQHVKITVEDRYHQILGFTATHKATLLDYASDTHDQTITRESQALKDYLLFYIGPRRGTDETILLTAKLLEAFLKEEDLLNKRSTTAKSIKECYDKLEQTHIGDPKTKLNAEKLLDLYQKQYDDQKNESRKILHELIPDFSIKKI